MEKRKDKPQAEDVEEPEAKTEAQEPKESPRDPSDDDSGWVLTPSIRNRWLSTGIHRRHAVHRGWGETSWHIARRKVISIVTVGHGVILGGERGTGKTQILADVCLHFLTSGKRARYINAVELGHRLRDAAVGAKHELQNLHDFIQSMDVIAIDEIQDLSGSDFNETEFRLLIDNRYAARKATVIGGNVDPDSAQIVLGDSIIRRINDGGGMLMCDWEPFDSEKAKK